LFWFPSPRIRSKRIGPRAPPNSSCDDIWFVLASVSNEVGSNTPYHSTPHTRDTLKTGRDWPVMSPNRKLGYWFHFESRVTKRTAERVTEVYRLRQQGSSEAHHAKRCPPCGSAPWSSRIPANFAWRKLSIYASYCTNQNLGDASDRLSGRSVQPRRASVKPSDASKHRYNFADAPLGTFWAFPEPGHLFQNVCQSFGRAPPTE